MKKRLDMEKIAKGLGAGRRGKAPAKGGHFGAMQVLVDVEATFRVPAGGGRPTDPQLTERRLVPPRAADARAPEGCVTARENGEAAQRG
jgi:hypothetical protein